MASFLVTKGNNKFRSKLIDKRCKNKHGNGRYRDVKASNGSVDRFTTALINNCARDNFIFTDNYHDEDITTPIPIWQCSLCTYINIERLPFCSMCNTALNFNFYSPQQPQHQPLNIKYTENNHFPKKKKKRKFRKIKHENGSTFASYWQSVTEFTQQHSEAAIRNRKRIQRQERRQQKLIRDEMKTDDSVISGLFSKRKNTKKKHLKPANTKLNITIRFSREIDSVLNYFAVKTYNTKHPKTRIRVKDYQLLDCLVTARDLKTQSIQKIITIKPYRVSNYNRWKHYVVPIYSVESGVEYLEDFPLVNQNYQNCHSKRRANYVKLNNIAMISTAANCIKASLDLKNDVDFTKFELAECHNSIYWKYAPILFTRTDLAWLLMEYIPQMDIVWNILIPIMGHRNFYYINMEIDLYVNHHAMSKLSTDGNNGVTNGVYNVIKERDNDSNFDVEEKCVEFKNLPTVDVQDLPKKKKKAIKPKNTSSALITRRVQYRSQVRTERIKKEKDNKKGTYHCTYCRFRIENHRCSQRQRCLGCYKIFGCRICYNGPSFCDSLCQMPYEFF